MKKIISIFVIILITSASSISFGQSIVSYPAETIPFEVNIVGTRYYADMASIINGLKRSPAVRKLVPVSESQNNLTYSGNYEGTPEALSSDIQGLAADRFSFESNVEKSGKRVFTLKKSAAAIPAQQIATPPPQDISAE